MSSTWVHFHISGFTGDTKRQFQHWRNKFLPRTIHLRNWPNWGGTTFTFQTESLGAKRLRRKCMCPSIGMESRGKDQRGAEVVCNGYSLGLAFLHHQEINGEISVHQIWWHQSLSLPPESIVFSIVSSSSHKERWGACWAGAVRQIESVISNNMRPSSWETDCLNNSLCVCMSLVDECKAKREMEVWFQINKMTLMDG